MYMGKAGEKSRRMEEPPEYTQAVFTLCLDYET